MCRSDRERGFEKIDGAGPVLRRQRHVKSLKVGCVRRVTPDQIVRFALELGGDRFQHRLGVIAAAALDLVHLAAIDADGLSQLRLGKAAMSAPFTKIVRRRRVLSIHFLQSPD